MLYKYLLTTITNKRGDIVDLTMCERTRMLLNSNVIAQVLEPKTQSKAEKRTRKGGSKPKDANKFTEVK